MSTELRDRGLLPLTEQKLTWAFRILDDILKHEADQLKAQHAPAIEAVWNIDIQKLREDLKGWLRYTALNDSTWVPKHFEMEFEDVRIFDNWLLKGRIDLVETSERHECESPITRRERCRGKKTAEGNWRWRGSSARPLCSCSRRKARHASNRLETVLRNHPQQLHRDSDPDYGDDNQRGASHADHN